MKPGNVETRVLTHYVDFVRMEHEKSASALENEGLSL